MKATDGGATVSRLPFFFLFFLPSPNLPRSLLPAYCDFCHSLHSLFISLVSFFLFTLLLATCVPKISAFGQIGKRGLPCVNTRLLGIISRFRVNDQDSVVRVCTGNQRVKIPSKTCHLNRPMSAMLVQKEKSSSSSSWASSSSSNPLTTRLYKPPLIIILSQGQRMYARRLMLSSATFLVKQEVFQLLSGCFLQTSRWMQLAALMWAIPRREPAAHLADKQRQDTGCEGRTDIEDDCGPSKAVLIIAKRLMETLSRA